MEFYQAFLTGLLGEPQNLYQDFRETTFCTQPGDIGAADEPGQAYGVLADVHNQTAVYSLACFRNGVTSVYFKSGGSMDNVGRQHPAVADAAQALLAQAGDLLDQTEKTDELPELPPPGTMRTFVLMPNGIFSQTFVLGQATEDDTALGQLTQETLAAIWRTITPGEQS